MTTTDAAIQDLISPGHIFENVTDNPFSTFKVRVVATKTGPDGVNYIAYNFNTSGGYDGKIDSSSDEAQFRSLYRRAQ